MGQLTLVLFRAVFAYGSSRYFFLFFGVFFGGGTFFSFIFVFETGSHCRGLSGAHRDPPAPLSQPPVLGLKALLCCSFEIGSHFISLTGIELNVDVIHQVGLNLWRDSCLCLLGATMIGVCHYA